MLGVRLSEIAGKFVSCSVTIRHNGDCRNSCLANIILGVNCSCNADSSIDARDVVIFCSNDFSMRTLAWDNQWQLLCLAAVLSLSP